MLYRKAAVVGVAVGLLLAIAVATIDGILVARLLSGVLACPDPRCTRAVQIVESEPMHVLIALALGFVAAFAWALRRRSPRDV
jgi:hypothetical protein